MATPDTARLRILVGAGSFVDAEQALRIIARLPADTLAGLGGILVEEVDTLVACQIPHQRVVLPDGTTRLAPDLSQVRTLLKADARAFRKSLENTAKPDRADWVFAQDKGDLVGAALRAAQGWDVLIFGYRQVHKVTGKVVTISGSGAASPEIDAAADSLKRQFVTDRIDMSVSAAPNPRADTQRFSSFDECLRTLARTNALAVLVDLSQGPVKNHEDLARLLEAARCPLFVFGASPMQSLLGHSIHVAPDPPPEEREI